MAKIEFPNNFIIHNLEELPDRWNQYPYSSKTTRIFSEFAKNRDFFALKVPSTIVPIEHNIILNPLYKGFGKVEIIDFMDLPIDERLKTMERLKK